MTGACWRHVALAVTCVAGGGCGGNPHEGGGQTTFAGPRRYDVSDVALLPGYRLELVARDLTFPTGAAFDGDGRLHVVESGYSYGEAFAASRLLRLEDDGRVTPIATGDDGPWNGVEWHDGAFYVSAAGLRQGGGRLLRIQPDGTMSILVDGLPSIGDHHVNGPALGKDGWLYFAVGVATNAGVVGPDNVRGGWVARHPSFHDVPCQDVTLGGRDFQSTDPRDGSSKRTGAYMAYGMPSEAGQVVAGRVPCTGAVLRVRPDGGAPELVAWGFRNPFGLAFGPEDALYATDNGYDRRGSRQVYGAEDALWRVQPGTWYGFPDYAAGRPIESGRFETDGQPAPGRLLSEHPATPPRPVAYLPVHASANGLAFSRDPRFGFPGDAFVAEFGDMAPEVGEVNAPIGFKISRVHLDDGVVSDFAVNRGRTTGPASRLEHGGMERPVALRFDAEGTALYVVDFGVLLVTEAGFDPRPGTGAVWRIVRSGGQP